MPELVDYPDVEGAFWGNLFAAQPYINACYNSATVDNSRAYQRDCAAGHLISGSQIVECGVIVDRSGGLSQLTSPTTGRRYGLNALWILDLPTYEPGSGTCPRCAAGEPIHAPGSTGTGPAA